MVIRRIEMSVTRKAKRKGNDATGKRELDEKKEIR